MEARSLLAPEGRKHMRSGSSGAPLLAQKKHPHSSSQGRLVGAGELELHSHAREAANTATEYDMQYVEQIRTVEEVLKKKRADEASDPGAQARKAAADQELRAHYEDLLLFKPNQSVKDTMMNIRRLVIADGLPEETDEEREKRSAGNKAQGTFCTLRGTIWKLLLGALHVDAQRYIELIELGPCWADHKLRNDTFRTFKGDEEFNSRVNESQLARVLNAYVRLNYAEPPPEERDEGLGYVQGMNVLLAPLLYVMPELDAFYCYNALLTRQCPRYVLKNMDGTHDGCELVDRILAFADPQLHTYLQRKGVFATIYAFPMILTLMGCLKPLSQVLKVWDAIFSFGIHLAVLLCVSQVILSRDLLLSDPNPMKYLGPRELAKRPMDAEMLVAVALKISRFIPRDMQAVLVKHPAERASIPAASGTAPGTAVPRPLTKTTRTQRSSSAERGHSRRTASEDRSIALNRTAPQLSPMSGPRRSSVHSPKRSPVRDRTQATGTPSTSSKRVAATSTRTATRR